jgi:hypothetical protein
MSENKKMKFEIIEENDLEFVQRGRKSNLSDEFVNEIKNTIIANKMVEGKKFLTLSELAIPSDLTDEKDKKNYKATTSAMLRGLANRLGYSSEIRWHKETVPAIRFGIAKPKAKK